MTRILLVDDEQNVLHALQRELKDCYEIEAFCDPAEALLRSKAASFDLVISDYKMPDMNGIQFLKQFGNIQPDAARLILSGQADINALISAINDTHIYRFIAKPWDRIELLSCITQALDFRNDVLESRRRAYLYRHTHAPSAPLKSKKTYRIILVDQDNVALSVMRRSLIQNTNYEGVLGALRHELSHIATEENHTVNLVVDAFTNAQIALEHAKHNACDLIITAQVLADMSGIQLLAEVKRIHPDTALILISNGPDKPMITQAIQAINETPVHSFLCLYKNPIETGSNISDKTLEVQQLKTAVMQALTSRDLQLESLRLAKLNEQH